MGLKLRTVLGIDPGLTGALVATDGESFVDCILMPVTFNGKDKTISFDSVGIILSQFKKRYGMIHVFLERAVPFAMGSKSAFNYGRGFEAITIAIEFHKMPLTLVEPAKWTKEMHEGISADLKPKAKSLIAVNRLFPQLVKVMPKKSKGGLLEGPMDALLIAGFALRKFSGLPAISVPCEDFY